MKTLTATETHSVLVANRLDTSAKPGFAFRNPSCAIFYDWHAHPCHQITYARRGTTQVEGPDGHHLLPTAHAIWIPAQTRHRTMICDLDGVSVYFDPACFPHVQTEHVQIFPITTMLQEMLLHTLRWQAGAAEQSPIAQSFSTLLACSVWSRCRRKLTDFYVTTGNPPVFGARHGCGPCQPRPCKPDWSAATGWHVRTEFPPSFSGRNRNDMAGLDYAGAPLPRGRPAG